MPKWGGHNKLDLVGQCFGRLLVMKDTGKKYQEGVIYLCQCDCGNIKEILSHSLMSGNTKSCGCLHKEQIQMNLNNITHGDAQKGKVRLYRTWQGMKSRCMNHPRYGGQGIKVCEEWENSYSRFKEWALSNGYADNLTIDRIDNNGNYEPTNCQWITKSENSKKVYTDRQSNMLQTFSVGFNLGYIAALKQKHGG